MNTPLSINNLSEFHLILSKYSKILIISHSNPDGDAIGSSLALAAFLRNIGKTVHVVMPDPFPDFYYWIPGASEICIFSREKTKAKSIIKESELIFCLDFNSLSRLGIMQNAISKSGLPKILIDHHLQPEPDFVLSFHSVEVSSTAELVFEVINELNGQKKLDSDIATGLYVGIMTDTGSFSYSCNRVRTYEVTAILVESGLDVREIHNRIYNTSSENRLRLLGHLLLNRMKVLPDYSTAYIYMSRRDQKKFDFQPGDSEGFVNYALSIQGIKFAAFFTEKKDLVRISFRSKGDFSVNDFARNHYSGGGHRNAAGGNSYLKLRAGLAEFEEFLPQYQLILNSTSI